MERLLAVVNNATKDRPDHQPFQLHTNGSQFMMTNAPGVEMKTERIEGLGDLMTCSIPTAEPADGK